MSWDPNQPQGQPPSGPNPYEPSPSTPPSGGPNPYEPSQPTPPPLQNPYVQPVSAPGYGQGPSYGYVPQTPLPLSQAIQGLPNQYIKILTRPGAQSFAEEQGKAEWGIIWIQLLIVGLVGTLIGLIHAAIGTAFMLGTSGNSVATAYGLLGSIFIGSSTVFSIISIIVGFFIVVGIQFLLAKAFRGTGTFVQQGYNYLLFYAPLAIISNVLGLIPILGGLIGFALWIYQIVLNVFAIMAAHRLSGGKATLVVLIPIIAIFLVFFLCAVVLVALLFHAASTLPSTP